MGELFFPKIHRSISDFLYEEEGNIPRSKMLMVGSMVLLLGILYAQDAFAAHKSHSSHRSHSSHSSHRSGSGSHSSHQSHQSHVSHSNNAHNSHSSHANSSQGGSTPNANTAPESIATPKPTATPVPVPEISELPSLHIPQVNDFSVAAEPMGLAAAAAVPDTPASKR